MHGNGDHITYEVNNMLAAIQYDSHTILLLH